MPPPQPPTSAPGEGLDLETVIKASQAISSEILVDKVVENVRALKTGGDDGDLGAMTSASQVAIVKNHLEDAVQKGAKVHTGGVEAISGSYIQPTVLTGVTHQMKVMSDETFGPVIPIQRVGSLDEAMENLKRDHDFLLKGDVFTEDVVETWLEWKQANEINAIRLRPHPYEYVLYYDA